MSLGDPHPPSTVWHDFKRLFRLLFDLRSYRRWMRLTFATVLAMLVVDLSCPLVVRQLFGVFTEPSAMGGLSTGRVVRLVICLGMAVLVLYGARMLLSQANYYVCHRFGWGGLCAMRRRLFEHIQRLSLMYFEHHRSGQLLTRVVADIQCIEHLVAHVVPTLLVNALLFLGVATILLMLNPWLALLTMVPIPVLLYLVRDYARRSRRSYRMLYGNLDHLSQIAQETVRGISVVQSFTLEDHRSERFQRRNDQYFRRAMQTANIGGSRVPQGQFVGKLGQVIVLLAGGLMVIQGSVPVKDLMAFWLYLGLFYQAVLTLNSFAETLQDGLSRLRRVYEVLDASPDVMERPNAVSPAVVEPRIQLEKVTFGYERNQDVLRGVTLDIEPGEHVALVGRSGSGKTTISKLLCRFYDPQQGAILIGGHDLRDLTLLRARSLVSLVSQDVYLFSASLRENIRYGRLDATDEEVEAAARLANVHDFVIGDLPHGYDTQVGERGARLSGGQRQRVSIARAILKNAPTLILDEATSSVDAESEHLIQQAFDRLAENRTTITIAHRLSTVIRADRIIALKNGRIVEQGTHHQLLQTGGVYAELYRSQLGDLELKRVG